LGSRAGSSLRLATFLNLEAPAEFTGLQRMQANRAREDYACARTLQTEGVYRQISKVYFSTLFWILSEKLGFTAFCKNTSYGASGKKKLRDYEK